MHQVTSRYQPLQQRKDQLLTVASTYIDRGEYASGLVCLIALAEAGDDEAISSLNSMCEQGRLLSEQKVSELAAFIMQGSSYGPLTVYCLLIDYLGGIDASLYSAALKILLPQADRGNQRAIRSLESLCKDKRDAQNIITLLAQFAGEGSTTARYLLENHFNAF